MPHPVADTSRALASVSAVFGHSASPPCAIGCAPSSATNASASHLHGTRGALAVPPKFSGGQPPRFARGQADKRIRIRGCTLGCNGPTRDDLLGVYVQPSARGGYSPALWRWRLAVFDPHSLAHSRRLLVPLDAFDFQRWAHYKRSVSNCQPNGLCSEIAP